MKILYVNWTYLQTFEIPDDTTPDEIEEFLDDAEPMKGTWNDREWTIQDKL